MREPLHYEKRAERTGRSFASSRIAAYFQSPGHEVDIDKLTDRAPMGAPADRASLPAPG